MTDKRTPRQAAEARKLQNLGVPLEIYEDEPKFVLIRQCGICSAFESAYGTTGFIFDISITSGLPKLGILSIDARLPWPDPTFHWLTDPAETERQARGYEYSGTHIRFDYNIAINHYINICRSIPRGGSIQGLLLGIGDFSIPPQFGHGIIVPAGLTVIDQFDIPHHQELDVCIDRLASMSGRKHSERRRRSLFERRDRVPHLR
jgi:hypothetical protein